MRTRIAERKLMKQLASQKIYDLSEPLFDGAPVHQADPPFLFTLYRNHSQTKRYFEDGFAYALELVHTSMHSGTHIDALCHMSKNGKLHGGIKIHDALDEDTGRFSKLGIETYPLKIWRGILLDIAAEKQVANLEPSYEITENDLRKAARFARVEIGKGDAVLVRTGYGKFYTQNPKIYLAAHPGLGWTAGKWLASNQVALVGTDNLSFDATPTKKYPAHIEIMVKAGVYVVKNLYLEELSDKRIYEFPLIVIPLKVLGATGSFVRPIALSRW